MIIQVFIRFSDLISNMFNSVLDLPYYCSKVNKTVPNGSYIIKRFYKKLTLLLKLIILLLAKIWKR